MGKSRIQKIKEKFGFSPNFEKKDEEIEKKVSLIKQFGRTIGLNIFEITKLAGELDSKKRKLEENPELFTLEMQIEIYEGYKKLLSMCPPSINPKKLAEIEKELEDFKKKWIDSS